MNERIFTVEGTGALGVVGVLAVVGVVGVPTVVEVGRLLVLVAGVELGLDGFVLLEHAASTATATIDPSQVRRALGIARS